MTVENYKEIFLFVSCNYYFLYSYFTETEIMHLVKRDYNHKEQRHH